MAFLCVHKVLNDLIGFLDEWLEQMSVVALAKIVDHAITVLRPLGKKLEDRPNLFVIVWLREQIV